MSCSFIESPNVYPSLTSHFPHGLLATRCGQCDVCNAGRANIFWSSMASKDGPRDLQPVSGSTSQGSGFLSASLSDGCCEIGPGMAKDRPLIVRSAPLQTVVPVSFSFRSKRHNNYSIIECTSPTAYI